MKVQVKTLMKRFGDLVSLHHKRTAKKLCRMNTNEDTKLTTRKMKIIEQIEVESLR